MQSFDFSHKIKISYEDKRVYLINKNHLPCFEKKKFLVIQYKDHKFKKHFEDYVLNGNIKNIVFISDNVSSLFISFKKHFKNITAAGGLVLNEKNQILMIFRRSKWDLPKGKIEKDETIEQAAVREVEEETGIKVDLLKDLLKTTFHIYLHKNKYYLKENHWYKMNSHSRYPLVPQTEEDIEKIEWVDSENIEIYLKNSFSSIKDVIKD